MSLDVAGPFTPAYDLGGHQARWFLAGALVWRVPKDTKKMVQPQDEALQGEEPAIEEGEDEAEGEAEEGGLEEEIPEDQKGEEQQGDLEASA